MVVNFINCLKHTKGEWFGKNFHLIDWQGQFIRDVFGMMEPNGYRQFNTAYIEIAEKQGKSELAAAVALLLICENFNHNIMVLLIDLFPQTYKLVDLFPRTSPFLKIANTSNLSTRPM